MMDAELKALEEKIAQFIELNHRLRVENLALRQDLAQAQGENRRLAEKIDLARARLESLLSKIPGEEE
jgi:cell division protein ZapB